MQYSTPPGAAVPKLEVDALEVRLGPRRLKLDHPCTLQAGRLYLLVGRSGTGKSSFARALLGFGELSDPPIACRASVAVTDAAGARHVLWSDAGYDPTVRRHVAFLPQAERLGFLDGLSVTDNLSLFSRSEPAQARPEIERLAEQFRLRPLPQRMASASGGERIRMSAIRGLLPRDGSGAIPAVVIADEPTAGLDEKNSASMARALLEMARGARTVVVVITHEPELFLGGRCPSRVVRRTGSAIDRVLY